MAQSIYFIQVDGEEIFKVGRTGYSVLSRLNSLQIGNHLKLKVFAYFHVPEKDKLVIEKQLHMALRKRKIRGEWFRANVEEIEDLAQQLGFELKKLDTLVTCEAQ
jgi:hypothetical protein